MTPLIGFRTTRKKDAPGSLVEVRPPAVTTAAPNPGAVETSPRLPDPLDSLDTSNPSRVADYAYRIAALTAGLVLLATVM